MPQKKATTKVNKKIDVPIKVLITQPRPEGLKSPYFDLAVKHGLSIDFQPFISVDPVSSKDFRKQKIDIKLYNAVIFTSKNAIDHFFRICDEVKVTVSQDNKYFCITEAVALYLQKFILYRKRKVFFGSQGNNKTLFDVMNRHKENMRFLYPCSESFDKDITTWLTKNNCEFALPMVYQVVSKDIREVVSRKYDIICLFTPGGVKSLMENFPSYKQNGTLIATFGENTSKSAEEAGLNLFIKAPKPTQPSMVSALEHYFSSKKSKSKTK